MKIYIKSESSGFHKPEIKSIADLFNSIDSILLVDDASKFDIVYDGDDEEDDYSDEELINLPDRFVNSSCSYAVQKRIYQIAPEKLHYFRAATLSEFLATKYTLRNDELNYILEKLKQCERVHLNYNYSKSREFLKTYNITDVDVLNIVHSLTAEDFDCLTQSYSSENFGNDLLVFLPDKDYMLENGNILSGIKIYMKIDYTTTSADGRTGVIMSIHEADPDKTKNQSNKKYPMRHLKRK